MTDKKEPVEHKDILGNPILDTSKLAVARHNQLYVCSILKITPKMMRVTPIQGNTYPKEFLAYPDNCVVVDGPDVLVYILKGKS